ncbi:MAG TPA: hypothetical protein VGI31_02945 [Streptosporangiaceae bacterium]
MSHPGEYPSAPWPEPGRVPAPDPASAAGPDGARLSFRTAVAAFLGTAAASALLGLLVGFAWAALAPRAVLVVQSRGVADLVHVETSAFIVADGWFCLLTGVAGLLCGAVGYPLAVRRYGAVAVTGLVVGGTGASLLAMWIGQQQGLAGFRSQLAASPAGTLLNDPLKLGGYGAIAFWPLVAAIIIGTIEVIAQARTGRPVMPAAPEPPKP